MSKAYRCERCDRTPRWRIDRQGDAVVTWSCDKDLVAILRSLQRPDEVTQLMVMESKS